MKDNIKIVQAKLCYPVEIIASDILKLINNNSDYSNMILYYFNNKDITKYDKINNEFWFSYNNFLSKFELCGILDQVALSHILINLVENYFKLKGITTRIYDLNYC